MPRGAEEGHEAHPERVLVEGAAYGTQGRGPLVPSARTI